MASTPDTQVSVRENHQPQQPKIQIYSPCNDEVSAFWREKYEKDAKKYWDIFYKPHQDRFFKDRHYLDKEWGHHFAGEGRRVILEVGCGAGNTIFPLLATYPDIFVHACDFSPRAVNLVKMHKDFTEARVNAFVCDLTVDDLSVHVAPSSVDIVTMPSGRVLFRDYATGDLAQRAFYFSDDFLRSLFEENGFNMEEHVLCCKQVENRSREIVMNRRWVQAVFQAAGTNSISGAVTENEPVHLQGNCEIRKDDVNVEIDMSEGMAVEMFGIASSREEGLLFQDKITFKRVSTHLHIDRLDAVGISKANGVNPRRKSGYYCREKGYRTRMWMQWNLFNDSQTRMGNKDEIEAIKQLNEKGFDIIIGTDVTYIPEAIIPLFATAKELISRNRFIENNKEPVFILCHVLRRVDEPSILSAASRYGFRLVDRWPDENAKSSFGGILESWFSDCQYELPSTALNIMCFHSG
ncbi:hypothetical protein DH2020_001826 [Rehmannia glutinosa]|uniref:Methyltransferase type 12 domain-containing protein n=1 Tax=Rehmannia glutinosa TaxID=99300 RepID=A0ABR0XSE1_REHGL